MTIRTFLLLLASPLLLAACRTAMTPATTPPEPLRVVTYNIEDVRTADVLRRDHPRLRRAAALIQRLRPDVILIAEMTYDYPGAPDVPEGAVPGQNGQRFADHYLAVSQGDGLAPLRYRAFQPETNTGVSSGYDLDRDGEAVATYPPLEWGQGGAPGPQTPEGRRYGNDGFGFGIYPGQYGFTLLVREGLEVLTDSVRTFQTFRWRDMPGALLPTVPETGESWYGEAESVFRLSSKNHADIPVRLSNGQVVHFLASHPTPPAFDGPEGRNKRRNHDEIRLWRDYLNGAEYLVDDRGRRGGLRPGASFVILGDLNADPDEGNTMNNAIRMLLDHPRVNSTFTPVADEAGLALYPNLDPDDTAGWGLRVDYLLPSRDLQVRDGGIVRPDTSGIEVSDHFLVWLDLEIGE